MTVKATIPVRPRLIPSTRFLLALLVSFVHVVLHSQRINLTMAIVCMVNKTGLNPELAGKMNNTANKRTTLFFQEKQFFWNEWDQQIILGSYWCGYLLTLVPSGWLSITMGAKLTLGISILISSLTTIALSSIYYLENASFVLMVSLRILVGVAHGSIFPLTYTLWTHWAVPDERGTLLSITFCGGSIGSVLSIPIGGLLCRYVYSGWIYMFFIPGVLGFIWLPLWMWQVSDTPERHRGISNTEREYIERIIGKGFQNRSRRPISLGSLPWKKIVQSKPVIGLFVTFVCNLFGFFFFSSNFGKVMTEIHGIPSQYTGYILACGFMLSFLNGILSGIIADNAVKKNLITLTNVRKLFNSLASFIPCLCMIAFYFCDENRQILAVISVLCYLLSGGFAVGSGYMVNISDIVPAYSGLISGIVSTVASFSGIIGNIIAGIIIQQPTLHDWRKLFIILGIVNFIGGVTYIFLGSAVPEEWATLKSQEQIQNLVHSQEETLSIQEEEQIDNIKA